MTLLTGFDLASFLQAIGPLGLFAVVFAESGLLIGFFLPGDSLLFTAGFLASQGFFNIGVIVVGCFIAAVLGDSVGYAFGRRVGPLIFKREQSLLFNPKNLERARRFYEAYGGLAIVLARFLPAIRTFAPILAGVGTMRYSTFVFYNVCGGALWAIGMPALGYFFGRFVPGADRYLIPIVLAVIILSSLPSLVPILRDRERRAWMVAFLRASASRHGFARKVIGAALVVFGLVSLVVPFFPFAWVAFIGLQLLGFRLLFLKKISSWWQGALPPEAGKPTSSASETSSRETLNH